MPPKVGIHDLLSTMSTHSLKTPDGQINGFITLADIYEYDGFVFEFHRYCGPFKLRKSDWGPAARQGDKFHETVDRWCDLSDEQKEDTRIHGQQTRDQIREEVLDEKEIY